jgi:hypothetical protein
MRAIALLLTCALLVASGAPGYEVMGETVVANARPSSPTSQGRGTKNTQAIMDDLKIERRIGEAVRLRADQLRRKNKAIAKAMRELESRGMRPAFDASMSIVAVHKSGQMAKISKQDVIIIDGDYELTFLSYDDGNNATWEGIIYFKRPEGEVIYDAQFDITTTPILLYQNRHGGIDGSTTRAPVVAQNTRSLQLSPISYYAGQPASTTSLQLRDALQRWAECAAAGCVSAAVVCRLSGPLWPQCAAIGCLGAMIQCAIEQIW